MTDPNRKKDCVTIATNKLIATNDDSNLNLSLHNNATDSDRITWTNGFKQIVACFLVQSIVVHAGINMSYSAVLLPQLNDTKSDIHVTKSEASWIASIVAISTPLGSFIIGPLIDRYGRKKITFTIGVYFAFVWLTHFLSRHYWHLFVARILAGFGSGLTTVALVYTSEITHPIFRTMMLSLNSVFVAFGILLTCVLGMWLSWRTMAIFNAAMSCLTVAMLWHIPESPHWFISFRDDPEQAQKSLKWLYKNPQICQNQYRQLITKVSTTQNRSGIEKSSMLTVLRSSLRQREVYRPFMVLFGIFVFQQLSCAYVIIFYAVDLFREIGGQFQNGIDEFVALVLLGTIRFVMAIVALIISKNVGRRPLFFVSGIGMFLTSLVAGVYLFVTVIPASEFKKLNIDVATNSNDNIALFCCLGYVCFSSLGYLVIPWTLIGELFPVEVRAVLGSCMISIAYIMMFAVVKVFPFVLDAVKIQCLFFYMSVISLGGVCFIFFFLPETLGKSFSEIEKHFRTN